MAHPAKPIPIDMKQGGDDLEDDFVIDETVALSGDEADGPGAQLDDEDLFDIGGDEDARNGDDEEAEEDTPTSPADADAAVAKKRKRREKEKAHKAKKIKLAEVTKPVEGSIAAQSPAELATYLAAMQAKSYPKLSAIELEDLRIPETSITDTTQWNGPRTADQLADFIIKVLPSLHTRLGQRSKANGSPTLLYVAGAALRVADITRVLKDKRLQGDKGGEVAKLFAKHFKLAEHVFHLQRTKVGAAVGTPGRIGKLLNETDALSVSQLSHIILDITHRDAKTFNVLDIRETRDEIFKTILNHEKVLEGIKSGKIQVVLF